MREWHARLRFDEAAPAGERIPSLLELRALAGYVKFAH
jgi:hypothetical protein